ncbi:type IV secretion system DNA-binding domain-containing protein [Enterococcus sp. 5H]|uniref:type IV secretion system DNA-binding domain-containing protein n=1 Tax=Enterococcus sp. 5H TaxID=1229490 RepID=UPI0023042483|nr:type IV secretion system DNA-binding domain-containing protein [Enterococcus sp. 5H]MDA9469887.1 hypothetical protein [Enterococcus sp. 5H]
MHNNNSPFGQLFNQQQEPKERTKGQRLALALTVGAFVFYPFLLAGFPLFLFIRWFERREEIAHVEDMHYETFVKRHTLLFGLLSFILFILNSFLFAFVWPRGYFSAYLFFPFNLFNHTLVFSIETLFALFFGGLGMTATLTTLHSFSSKRRVESKEKKRRAIQQSNAYKKRQAKKFTLSIEETKEYEERYQKAKRENDLQTLEEMSQSIYIGTDEYGKSYYMPFKEFNQHAFIVGTTGSGKTTALELIIDHCARYDLPCLVLDGKGAKATLESAEKIAGLRGKDVINFSDSGTTSYNPIKHSKSTAIKDKLLELAKTESIYYSGSSELLIMDTIQLMDHYDIPRSFKEFSAYLLPRNVLLLFAEEIVKLKPDLFTFEVEEKPKKRSKKEEGETVEKQSEVEQEELDMNELDASLNQLEEEVVSHEEVQHVTLDPETIDLEQLHGVLRHSKELLNRRSLALFDQLFTRYEHKKNPFYLYATSENLQTQINILMDSEIGYLFDTENNSNELDLLEVARAGQLAYVSLNGLVYTKFIKTMAQFIISDINFLASERYEISESFPFVVLFDEPSAYLTAQFIDTANKTRGAGVHAVFSPQTLADIETIDPLIKKQLIGNVNTYFVGQTNEPTEIDYWLKLFGTFDDIEVTSMVEQQTGYSDVSKTDWVAERGTQRDVENFIVRGQTLRDLRTGEFIVYRKGANSREPIRKVYLHKVS